jgi:predicted nucleic acid-binding protein
VGALTLPPSGEVYVDANAVIYAVEKIEPYHALLEPLWQAAQAGQLQIVTSELTWLETLARPLRDSNSILEALFRGFLTAREVRLIPASLGLWEKTARLRATGLRTPDALHAATALAAGCVLFVTNDPGFRRVAGLPTVLLSEVAAA